MAQKQHEMKYVISAQANGFTSAFKEAQATLSGTQQKLLEVTKVQADISDYQKQQQAIDKTKQQLELLEKQYDNYQREMDETGQFSARLANQQDKAAQRAKTAEQTLKQQEQALQQLGQALTEAGIDTENLASESDRLKTEEDQLTKEGKQAAQSMDQMEKEAKEAAEELKDMAGGADDAGEKSQSFGDKATAAVSAVWTMLAIQQIYSKLKEISEAFMACASASGDFQEAMSNVEALSGASESQMTELTATAKELGATTKFTAEESASAMGYMAMAGWDAEQMLSGIDATMALAAASGEDLASVSDIVTDSLTAFGLTAADTAHFADVLAATATSSNTSVGIMGETFKYAAPVAGALGYSIEDVSVAIGLMANAGIKGSNAGTALRNVFNGLLEGVTLTGDAFGEATVSAVQADGTMMNFSTTISTLRGYFDQMTEAERVNNAMAIAGQRGYAGLLSILNATDSDFAKLTDSINNCTGAAQEMADIKLDNLNGQLTLMQSAWDGVKIAVGDSLSPVLENVYGLLSDVMGVVTEFINEHPALVTGIAAAAGGLTIAAGAMAAFAAASAVAKAAGIGLSPMLGIIGGIAAAAGGIGLVVGKLMEMSNSAEAAYENMQRLSGEISTLTTNEGLVEEYRRLSEEVQNSALNTEELAQKQAELDAVTEQLKAAYPELLGQIDAGTRAWELQLQAIEATAEAERAAAMVEFTNNAGEAIGQLLDLKAAYEQAEADYAQLKDNMSEGLDLNVDGVLAHVEDLRDELQEGLELGEIEVGDDAWNAAIQEIEDWLNSVSKTPVSIDGLADVEFYLDEIGSKAMTAGEYAESWAQKNADAASNVASSYEELNAAQMMFQSFLDSGLVSMDGLRAMSGNADLSLSDLGMTIDDVGAKVASGALTVGQAAARYGLYEQDVRLAAEGYAAAQREANEAAEAGADALDTAAEGAGRSYREMLQLQFAAQMVEDGLMDAESAAQAYGLSSEALADYMSEEEAQAKNASAALALVENGYLSAESAAERFGVTVEDIDTERARQSLESYESAMGDLISTYGEVYSAAYESFSKQFSLWEQVDEVTATSLSDLQSAIDSQISYWNDYHANLEALQAYGLDTSGIWDHLTDGSEDAAAAAQGLVDAINSGDTGAVEDYVASYENLQSVIGDTSETVATTNEDVQKAMSEMWESAMQAMEDGISPDDLVEVAGNVMQGFVDGLDDEGAAAEQLSTIADTSLSAFKSALGVASPSTITTEAGENTMQGFQNGIENGAPAAEASLVIAATNALAAFNAAMNSSALYPAGRNAIQGAINGINSMIPSLVAAARSAGTQAANSYKAAQQIHSPSKLFAWFSEMDIKGAIQGLEKNQEEANKAFAAAAESGVAAYQEAGENMVKLSPYGDAVLNYGTFRANALASQAMQELNSVARAAKPVEAVGAIPHDSEKIVITLAPVFNITGVGDADGIRDELNAYTSDELREIVYDAVDERVVDAIRRGYI